jgi:hypothetical protein
LNSAPGVIWLRLFSEYRRGVLGCFIKPNGGTEMERVDAE